MGRYASVLSAAVMLLLCAGVATVSIVTGMRPALGIGVWVALLVVCVVAFLGAAMFSTAEGVNPVSGTSPRWSLRGASCLSVSVLASWALLLSMPEVDLMPVLHVIIAAIAVSVVPLPVVFLLCAGNTVVIAIATSGSGQSDAVILTAFYLCIHLASVLSSYSLFREIEMRQRLEAKHVELAAAYTLLDSQSRADERLRISRDLHDLVGHQLTVLSLELEAARHQGPERSGEHLDRAAGVTRELLGSVRETVGELRRHPPGELRSALENVTRAATGLVVDLEIADDVEATEDEIRVLLHVVREVVTNALRHANARTLAIDVHRSGGDLVLSARDDGDGATHVVPGHGLTDLRHRVALHGGEVEFGPAGGGWKPGFRVTARLTSRSTAAAPAGTS